MLSGSKIIKSICIVFAIAFAALASVFGLLLYLFPAGDFGVEIAGGYYFSDSGGDERFIYYPGADGEPGIAVDARVDAIRVDGDFILVARRPRAIHVSGDGVPISELAAECEFWSIDVVSHRVERIETDTELSCNWSD